MAVRLRGAGLSGVGAASLVVLIGAFLAAFGGPAHAQPALEFTNTPPLKLTLADKQDTSVECNPETGQQKDVQRADSGPRLKTATVWVRYADSAEALNNVRFDARAKANPPGPQARLGRTSRCAGIGSTPAKAVGSSPSRSSSRWRRSRIEPFP